jgi:hypothetical protein
MKTALQSRTPKGRRGRATGSLSSVLPRLKNVPFPAVAFVVIWLFSRASSAHSSPTPIPTPFVGSEFFRLTDVENIRIVHPRGAHPYALLYELRDAAGSITSWGHIFDAENRFYDKQSGGGEVLLRSFTQAGYSTQSGDNLLVTYDGGREKHIYLPAFTGYTELYVASDGSTYFDRWLCQTAQAAFPPTPTPTMTPSGYRTVTPTPTQSPTPYGFCTPTATPWCYCSTWLEGPWTFTLSEAEPFQMVTYLVCNGCCGPVPCNAEELCDWYTVSSEWLLVQSPCGFGPRYGGRYDVTVSLGDVSGLSPGWHQGTVTFDTVPNSDWIRINANYFKPAPLPTPSPTAILTPSPTTPPTPVYVILESGDYDGDGRSEIAVFRPSSGLWAVRNLGRVYFGRQGDIPVSGDYDGDGITDVAVFRPGSGLWAVKDITRFYFGGIGDIPAPGDYGGTGSTSAGVFQSASGVWVVRDLTRVYFGQAGDLPVPGDYSGDGVKELAIFRPATGLWAVKGLTRSYFGRCGDTPVPGVYGWYGPGKNASPVRAIIAVYRPSSGLWTIMGSERYYFGRDGDSPVIGDFTGNSLDDTAVFRPSSGLWAIRGVTRAYFGSDGDIPVAR